MPVTTPYIVGRRSWVGGRDEDGHRTYYVVFRIAADRIYGPAAIMQTPGLPFYGQPWIFSDTISSDIDIWAFCKMPIELTPLPGEGSGEPVTEWDVKFTFTTKSESKRCHENQIEDPLLIPDRVSGSLAKYTEEATTDRFGKPIQTSSFEQLRGPQVEFDANRDVVKIEQNVPDLQLPLLVSMRDTLNDAPLWGFPKRCIKLSTYSWEKKYFGVCEIYYVRSLEFETNPTGFDRDILDEGTKVLNGHWNENTLGTGSSTQTEWILDPVDGLTPDPSNPQHFIRFKDRNGENCKVILNGAGLPAGATTASTTGGPYFVSVVPTGVNTGVNKANPLSNNIWWKRINGDPVALAWSEFQTYAAGDVVTYSGGDYICKLKHTNLFPIQTFGRVSEVWIYIGSLTSGGAYDRTTSYTLGQYVTAGVALTAAGYIHVEKHSESDFLQLGIPTTI